MVPIFSAHLVELLNDGSLLRKITFLRSVCVEKEIVKTQDEATLRMAKICPKYAPEKSYLTSIGGEH